MILKKILGYCSSCRRYFKYPYKARQRTNYVDDERNWYFGCKSCHEENDRYWADMLFDAYGYRARSYRIRERRKNKSLEE